MAFNSTQNGITPWMTTSPCAATIVFSTPPTQVRTSLIYENFPKESVSLSINSFLNLRWFYLIRKWEEIRAQKRWKIKVQGYDDPTLKEVSYKIQKIFISSPNFDQTNQGTIHWNANYYQESVKERWKKEIYIFLNGVSYKQTERQQSVNFWFSGQYFQPLILPYLPYHCLSSQNKTGLLHKNVVYIKNATRNE